MADWCATISAGLQQSRGIAYAQKAGTAIDPTLVSMYQADLGKQGWVLLDGKFRRFLDLAAGRLAEQDGQQRTKRVIPLEGCSVSMINPTSFLVCNVSGSYVYECPKEDTRDWVNSMD